MVNDKQENRNNDSNDGDPITVGDLLACRLQAAELDTLQAICWRIGRLAYADEKPPTSILNTLLGKTEAESEDSPVQYFDSPEEFEAAMRAAEGGEPDGKRH